MPLSLIRNHCGSGVLDWAAHALDWHLCNGILNTGRSMMACSASSMSYNAFRRSCPSRCVVEERPDGDRRDLRLTVRGIDQHEIHYRHMAKPSL